MTEKELKDIAYQIATSTTMVEGFNFKEFQNINCLDYAWEPLEYWDESSYTDLITGIAFEIERRFSYLLKES